jgi:hypothetical protein
VQVVTLHRLTWQRVIVSHGHNHRNIQLYIPVTPDQRYDRLLPRLRRGIASFTR